MVVWAVLVAGIGSLFVFANQKQGNETCQKLNIKVEYNQADPLINERYILRLITNAGIKIKGQPLKSIPTLKVQQLLAENPYICEASVRIGVDGMVNVFVSQRKALVKVMPAEGASFYLDTEGVAMPLSRDFPARVMVANGYIKSGLPKVEKKKEEDAEESVPIAKTLPPDLQKIFVAASALSNREFTLALTEQIYLNYQGELEIIPKIGDQTIVLGDTTHLNEKIENLKTFYTRGMQADSWSNYRSISVKYRNQVICTKTTQNGSI